MSRQTLLWVGLAVIGLGLIISADVFRDKPANVFLNPSPTPSQTASPSVSPSPTFSPAATPRPSPAAAPASCQLSGSIEYISGNIYETKGAKIVYQNVDDKIRQIYWKLEPDDGTLTAGPNLFEQLDIPDGEREVGVSLNKTPVAESYVLTAAVTYGERQLSGEVLTRVAECSGFITVDTSRAK